AEGNQAAVGQVVRLNAARQNGVFQFADRMAPGPQAAAGGDEVVQVLLPHRRPARFIGVRQYVDVVASSQIGRIADHVRCGRDPGVGVVGYGDVPVRAVEHGAREAGDLAVDVGG